MKLLVVLTGVMLLGVLTSAAFYGVDSLLGTPRPEADAEREYRQLAEEHTRRVNEIHRTVPPGRSGTGSSTKSSRTSRRGSTPSRSSTAPPGPRRMVIAPG
jgi:hypothetical protein